MTDKIIEFVDSLFEGAPLTREMLELKEQTVSTATERYTFLVNQGKNDMTAFNIAVSEIGDLSTKIAESAKKSDGAPFASSQSSKESATFRDQTVIHKSASTALWMLIIIAYFIVSFFTHAWRLTWLIFLIGVALDQILKICFHLKSK